MSKNEILSFTVFILGDLHLKQPGMSNQSSFVLNLKLQSRHLYLFFIHSSSKTISSISVILLFNIFCSSVLNNWNARIKNSLHSLLITVFVISYNGVLVSSIPTTVKLLAQRTRNLLLFFITSNLYKILKD